MIILLDLDGTLTNTAHLRFKEMKDGIIPTNHKIIPVFKGAVEFVKQLKELGHMPIIVSDSHTKYVKPIADNIFQIPFVSLTDKPNIEKTKDYIISHFANEFKNKDNFIMVGDSWLDIELGRRLNLRTVLTNFYKASHIEERDGIGQSWKPIKMGPTYYAENFESLLNIIKNPLKELLALEAIFQGIDSDNMVKFHYEFQNGGFIAFRCLSRQEDGECDRFARADKYYQIDNPNRTLEFLGKLSSSISNYLKRVANFPEYRWDFITYVSDKKTTTPPNKMKEIFDLIDSPYNKVKLFKWSDEVQGSLRNQPDYKTRRKFISKYLTTRNDIDLKNKSIIVIDDQFTSSATAKEIAYQLKSNGAKNILFVSLFYLILPIESKVCPKCNKLMKVKIRKTDGNKFYSCVPPKYRGIGCGHIENIVTQ